MTARDTPIPETLSDFDDQAMAHAATEIIDCMRVLAKSGENIVSAVLEGRNFIEWEHYPADDVYDSEFLSQFYFHAHPTETGERPDYGHFHTFLRIGRLPAGEAPRPVCSGADEDAICHLIGISMSREGVPVRLFTTNQWVTGESWYSAKDVIAMLGRFKIDLSSPSWPLSRWLTAMLILFRADIEELVFDRDRTIDQWRRANPGADVFEDRRLEITSSRKISLPGRIEELARRKKP